MNEPRETDPPSVSFTSLHYTKVHLLLWRSTKYLQKHVEGISPHCLQLKISGAEDFQVLTVDACTPQLCDFASLP